MLKIDALKIIRDCLAFIGYLAAVGFGASLAGHISFVAALFRPENWFVAVVCSIVRTIVWNKLNKQSVEADKTTQEFPLHEKKVT